MKIITLAFFIFYFPHLLAQDLKNMEWTQIEVERKDGSRIVDHSQIEKSFTKYYFRDKTVFLVSNNLYFGELPYSVNNKILSIGKANKYTIDTIDSEILALTQIPNKELADDKINRFIFLNRHSIFKYLNENEKIEITEDSLIEYNTQFAPTYYGDIDAPFVSEFSPHSDNKKIVGAFIMNPKGKIENVQFEGNKNFSGKDLTKFAEIIKSTNSHWVLPETLKPFYYKVDFAISFTYIKPFSGVNFSYTRNVSDQKLTKSLTMDEIIKADNFFNKGNEFLQKEKYENAGKQFKKCIAIDSLYLDAYYNLAFCYQKLGNKDLACEIWNKLKIWGQKQGEYLYNENCK